MDEQEVKKIIKLPKLITVKNFSALLDLPVPKIITELMKNGIIANINEEIDYETASVIAQDLGFETQEDLAELEKGNMTLEDLIEICKKENNLKTGVEERAPIVTILGHVDHGKTTLLDTIRKTNVADKEAGGITQHIRAYQVKKKGKAITFIDTPGHEAFSAMRERGVSIADIVVLVVAADDSVRPQTKEVIEYLKTKNMPTIVAINKVDKPQANIPKVKQDLADNGLLIEEWGGKIICVEISAKQNKGIDTLLENILLLNEVENFKADFNRDGLAVVLEAHLDPQKGPVSTVLVKTGTLKVGQSIYTATTHGKIRKMEDFLGKNMITAEPSTPVTIIGMESVPNSNEVIQASKEKNIFQFKSKGSLHSSISSAKEISQRKIYSSIDEGKTKKIKLILKADVQGSVEAIEQILSTIKSEKVVLEFLDKKAGNITESDVKIAASAGAFILGFNVIITPVAKRIAENSGVEVKTFDIIYKLAEEVKAIMLSFIPPEIVRTDIGKLNVLAIFKNGKKDMIVGGRVVSGKIEKNSFAEVTRGEEIIGKGKITNLQHNKTNVVELNYGNECGVTFEGDVKIKEKDSLVIYKEEEVKPSL
jgi:translation initiation factor IF-2